MLLGFRIDFISDMDGVMLEPLNYEVGFKLQVPSGDLSEVVLRELIADLPLCGDRL